MSLRTSRPGHTARFDWEDGSTRVNVSFIDKGAAKSTVTVAHERLPDPDDAEAAKASWRERLANLKAYLEP
jgi:Activator of Hsp90 ATPase homolog 1-like protein